MSGSVRPLLFWFGRNDIGLARIVWKRGNGGCGYELLVGTDPAKAPRALNRWGFIAEGLSGSEGDLLALMTESGESTYGEADASTVHSKSAGNFLAIRGRVRGGTSVWQTTRLTAPTAPTIHDLDAVLEQVQRETSAAPIQQAAVPDGARPGFLIALGDLIERGAAQDPETPAGLRARTERIRYVFGKGAYELGLSGARSGQMDLNGRNLRVVTSSFEIRILATHARTRFDVTFGTDDRLASVPVAVEWQPHWWLRVQLRLLEEGGACAAMLNDAPTAPNRCQ